VSTVSGREWLKGLWPGCLPGLDDSEVTVTIGERFERCLWGTAKVICMAFFVAGMLACAIVGVALLGAHGAGPINGDPAVSASEVLSGIPGTESANDLLSVQNSASVVVPNAAGLVMPSPLKSVLIGNDAGEASVNDWLDRTPLADRQSFLNELSVVVASAGQHAAAWEWDDRQRYVAAAMNQYARTKIERIAAAQSQAQARTDMADEYRVVLGVLLAMMAGLTVLLLLMAIERNTRGLRPSRS
jgi:hypothetical protein